MAPTHQEETNQKVSIDLASLQDRLNKDIPTIHEKTNIIQAQLHNTISEVKDHLGGQINAVHSTLHQFMTRF